MAKFLLKQSLTPRRIGRVNYFMFGDSGEEFGTNTKSSSARQTLNSSGSAFLERLGITTKQHASGSSSQRFKPLWWKCVNKKLIKLLILVKTGKEQTNYKYLPKLAGILCSKSYQLPSAVQHAEQLVRPKAFPHQSCKLKKERIILKKYFHFAID